jgi:hypothetical protein
MTALAGPLMGQDCDELGVIEGLDRRRGEHHLPSRSRRTPGGRHGMVQDDGAEPSVTAPASASPRR